MWEPLQSISFPAMRDWRLKVVELTLRTYLTLTCCFVALREMVVFQLHYAFTSVQGVCKFTVRLCYWNGATQGLRCE